MNNNLYLARQPIMDQDEHIIGYEFFYRDEHGECTIDDPRHATAAVLVNLLNQVGSVASFGDALAFINTDGPLLLTDILRSLPKEKFIFELSASMKLTSQVHEAIRYFHGLGYRFALDNASFHTHYLQTFSPIFPYITYAKFDVTQTDIEQFNYQPNPYGTITLIAQKVEFYEMAEAYAQIGFRYFQGFYFAKAHLITHNRIDPQYVDLLSLFALLQKDASPQEIADALQNESALSLQLIQFLSSSYPEYLEGADSIQEMILRTGNHILMQWLLLIIYSKSGTKALDASNAHSVFAQKRVELMLKLLLALDPSASEKSINNARLIAFISLLEGVMNVPMESILHALRPTQEIADALFTHTGVLGRIYAAALKIEIGDLAGASILLKSYGINLDRIGISG